MAISIAQQIIRKNVSNQIAFNIIDLKNSKEMPWNKLKNIYTKVGQEVVYSIIQELFHCSNINKSERYKKPVIQIFREMQYVCKYFWTIMTLSSNFWDIIVIVIAFDFLHKDFDTINASLLEMGNKIIDQIQSISVSV